MDDGGSQAGPIPAPVRAPTVGGLDWAIIVFYLVLSVSVGLFCGRRSQGGDSDEYLLAGKGTQRKPVWRGSRRNSC